MIRVLACILLFLFSNRIVGQKFERIVLKDENSLKVAFQHTFTDKELKQLRQKTKINIKCFINLNGDITSAEYVYAVSPVMTESKKEMLKANVIKYCQYIVPKDYRTLDDSLRYVSIMYYRR